MPTLGVDVAVINSEGKVLLTKREDFPVWCLPGGGVENGESIAEAALREVYEETGIEIELQRLVGIYSRPYWHGGGDHVILFTACPVGGILKIQPSEVTDIGYFEPTQLPQNILAWHRIYLSDALTSMGSSVVKKLDVHWPFVPSLSREQLYAMRDNGEISPTQMARLHAPLDPGVQKIEVSSK